MALYPNCCKESIMALVCLVIAVLSLDIVNYKDVKDYLINDLCNDLGINILGILINYDYKNKNQWPLNNDTIIEFINTKIKEFGYNSNTRDKIAMLGLKYYKGIPISRLESVNKLKGLIESIPKYTR